jgi:GT2 family glycosyltransferase
LAQNRSSYFKSEVYLIDQNSQPDMTESLAKRYGFHAIALRSNVGISRGINLLASMARGNYISLVTSDTIFPNHLDIKMIDVLQKNSDIYQVCPASYKTDIPYQKYTATKNELTRCIAQELTIQFWPRTTFERIGFFEEKFKAKYENLDFALRCFIDGGYAAIDHTSVCEHIHNMTTKNGSIDQAYDGYIERSKVDNTLRKIWDTKWPGLNWNMLYDPNALDDNQKRNLQHFYSKNIFLDYIQDVGY